MKNIKDITEKNNLPNPPKVGEIIAGKVIGTAHSGIYLDLGPQGTGIIYGREFSEMKNTLRNLKIGDEIFAKITDLEDENGYIELSLKSASEEMGWETLKKKKEESETIDVKISGANKGGLLSEISGISAFLPVSQLSPKHYPRVEGGDKSKILRELQKLVGTKLEVKIFDLNQGEEKLILSEKAEIVEDMKDVLKNYNVGDIVEGEITGVVDFGAFIKFPLPAAKEKTEDSESPDDSAVNNIGLEGLIHISQLDWQLIGSPSEIVKPGQKVKAKIIEISDDGKVSLSLKALKKDPWEGIANAYKKDDVVKGTVAKFNPFGAFIQISSKIQGLIHISEFSSREEMEKAIEEGKKYEFEILSIVPTEHKMSLRLKTKSK